MLLRLPFSLIGLYIVLFWGIAVPHFGELVVKFFGFFQHKSVRKVGISLSR